MSDNLYKVNIGFIFIKILLGDAVSFKETKNSGNCTDFYTCKITGCGRITNSSRKMLSHLNVNDKQDANFLSPCLFTTECFHGTNFQSSGGLYRHLQTFHPYFFYKPASEQSQVIEAFRETEICNTSAIVISK
jgi:hypothetical protein